MVCLCVCLCLFVYHDRTSPAETDEPTEMPFVNEVNAVEPFARAIQPGLTATGTHMPYGSHSVTCHPAEVTFPPLHQPKLVLDLATIRYEMLF